MAPALGQPHGRAPRLTTAPEDGEGTGSHTWHEFGRSQPGVRPAEDHNRGDVAKPEHGRVPWGARGDPVLRPSEPLVIPLRSASG